MNIKKVIVGLLDTNCYILSINDKCLIIDPGDDFNKIKQNINGKVIGIIITHKHFDHIGALEECKKEYNVPIYNFNNLEEKEISVGPFNFEVIYTFGHTNDSITLYFKKENIMFTGDFLFNDGIGRTDLATGSITDMQKSLKKISKYNHNIIIYPGHGEKGLLKECENYE